MACTKQGCGARYAISLDVGGTLTKVAVVDATGQIVQRLQAPSARDIPRDRVPEHVVQIVHKIIGISGLSREQIVGACVGIPGVIDRRTDLVVSCPNLTNWEGLPLAKLVQEKLGIPTYLEKDANEAALGEHWLGAGQGIDDLICFTIGTGIGTGIILNGQLYRGSTGGAGEIGHIIVDKDGPLCTCGNRGCLEAVASARAIAEKGSKAVEHGELTIMRKLSNGDPKAVTTEMVFRAARAGDQVAQRILDEALTYLGVGVTSIVNVFNPAMIILGGGVAQAGEQLLAPVQQIVRQRARRLLAEHVQIVLSRLGNDAGVIGGAYLVFQARGIISC
ncbi:MAG: ROK family protein [Anaerolineae bacterium]